MPYKESLRAVAVAITFFAFLPYGRPETEFLLLFALFAVRNVIVIMALEAYSLSTVLFAVVIAVACISLKATMLSPRRVLAR
jgi:hypothetical protein